MSELGRLLRKLRGKESLRDAARRANMSHTYLSVIEKGKDLRSGNEVKPTPETLKLLSSAYNHPYEDLMQKAGYLENDMPKFYLFFAQERENSGFKSQRRLAQASGISNGSIARIESGNQKPSPETIKILSKYLNSTSYEELMQRAGYIPQEKTDNYWRERALRAENQLSNLKRIIDEFYKSASKSIESTESPSHEVTAAERSNHEL